MLIDLYATALCCMLAIMSPYWVTGTYKAVSSCASFFLATGLEMKWPRFVVRELSGTFNTPCFSLGHFCYCWFSPSFKTHASKIFNPLSFEVVDSVSKYISCPLKLFCPFFTFFFFFNNRMPSFKASLKKIVMVGGRYQNETKSASWIEVLIKWS